MRHLLLPGAIVAATLLGFFFIHVVPPSRFGAQATSTTAYDTARATLQASTTLAAAIDEAWSQIQSGENTFLIENNKYWQSIGNYPTLQSNGKKVPRGRITSIAQRESLDEIGVAGDWPFVVQIEEYKILLPDNTEGRGYTAFFRMIQDSFLFTKAKATGPESERRTFDWL